MMLMSKLKITEESLNFSLKIKTIKNTIFRENAKLKF